MSRVIIDADGDLLLRIPEPPLRPPEAGDGLPDANNGTASSASGETRELLVSSKALTHASPVFKVMFDERFKEGSELAAARASPYKVLVPLYLPEVNADAMELLMKTIHFVVNDHSARPKTSLLEDLADAADQYDCLTALSYWGAIWVRNWNTYFDTHEPYMEDLCRLFVFAYVVDLPREFCDIAWTMLLERTGPFEKSFGQNIIDHPLLPEDITSKTFLKWRC